MAVSEKVIEPTKGPGLTGTQICADFARDKSGNSLTGYYRIGTTDLNRLIASWKILEPPRGPGVPPDCLDVP